MTALYSQALRSTHVCSLDRAFACEITRLVIADGSLSVESSDETRGGSDGGRSMLHPECSCLDGSRVFGQDRLGRLVCIAYPIRGNRMVRKHRPFRMGESDDHSRDCLREICELEEMFDE